MGAGFHFICPLCPFVTAINLKLVFMSKLDFYHSLTVEFCYFSAHSKCLTSWEVGLETTTTPLTPLQHSLLLWLISVCRWFVVSWPAHYSWLLWSLSNRWMYLIRKKLREIKSRFNKSFEVLLYTPWPPYALKQDLNVWTVLWIEAFIKCKKPNRVLHHVVPGKARGDATTATLATVPWGSATCH